jgi:hypothetical protein
MQLSDVKDNNKTIGDNHANTNTDKSPIFLLGIMQRSGTNYLQDILCLHPDCGTGPMREDFLLHYADFIQSYISNLSETWRRWIDDEEFTNLLYSNIGNSLVSFLKEQTEEKWLKIALQKEPSLSHIFKPSPQRLVTKTPSVENLDCFFKLFPNSQLIIIVRDGRAVAESYVKSFNSFYEMAMREWAKAAQEIISFIEHNQNSQNKKYYVVKYEDLCNNNQEELLKIFDFLGLNPDLYSFEEASKSAVRGSSSFRGDDRSLHWKSVKKSNEFNPNLRGSNWNQMLHQRFNWIAGEYLVKLGYEKKYEDMNYLWKIWNHLEDFKWWGRNKIKSVVYALNAQGIVRKIRNRENS